MDKTAEIILEETIKSLKESFEKRRSPKLNGFYKEIKYYDSPVLSEELRFLKETIEELGYKVRDYILDDQGHKINCLNNNILDYLDNCCQIYGKEKEFYGIGLCCKIFPIWQSPSRSLRKILETLEIPVSFNFYKA